MKKIIIYGLLAGVFIAATGCSDSYLDLKPENSVTPETLFANPSDAQYAINGIGKLMCSQYLSTQGLNGEGTINLYYGDYAGASLQKSDLTGWRQLINSEWNENATSTNNIFPWHYNYRLILNANQILSRIPQEETDQNIRHEWDHIKAQALTYRANAYLRLVQIYSRRWSDKNGESRGVVLRLDPTTDAMPCSSLKEVYAQIYADLEEAISLFSSCGINRSNVWQPSEEVAHAIYSRAALNREDWSKAISEAKLASKKSKLMTAEQYESGFNTPNDEWIWCAYNDAQQDIYYYSFFSYAASNSSSSSIRSYPLEISKQVVEKIASEDSRLALYAIPLASEEPVYPDAVVGAGKVVFYNDEDFGKLKESYEKETDPKKKESLEKQIANIPPSNAFYSRVKAKGSFLNGRIVSNGTLYYYHATKFQNLANPGVGQVCLYRMAEMLYNEAEAQYRIGNEAEAAAALEQAVRPYQPSYACTKSGDALLEEILNYREFDLWGEGFSWFDMKRRGATLDRKGWADGGSWNSTFTTHYGPSDVNNWTFVIPQNETNYNPLVTANEGDDWKKQ